LVDITTSPVFLSSKVAIRPALIPGNPRASTFSLPTSAATGVPACYRFWYSFWFWALMMTLTVDPRPQTPETPFIPRSTPPRNQLLLADGLLKELSTVYWQWYGFGCGYSECFGTIKAAGRLSHSADLTLSCVVSVSVSVAVTVVYPLLFIRLLFGFSSSRTLISASENIQIEVIVN